MWCASHQTSNTSSASRWGGGCWVGGPVWRWQGMLLLHAIAGVHTNGSVAFMSCSDCPVCPTSQPACLLLPCRALCRVSRSCWGWRRCRCTWRCRPYRPRWAQSGGGAYSPPCIHPSSSTHPLTTCTSAPLHSLPLASAALPSPVPLPALTRTASYPLPYCPPPPTPSWSASSRPSSTWSAWPPAPSSAPPPPWRSPCPSSPPWCCKTRCRTRCGCCCGSTCPPPAPTASRCCCPTSGSCPPRARR